MGDRRPQDLGAVSQWPVSPYGREEALNKNNLNRKIIPPITWLFLPLKVKGKASLLRHPGIWIWGALPTAVA